MTSQSDDEHDLAIHEAGHAVAYLRLGKRIAKVTVIPDRKQGSAGHVERARRGAPPTEESKARIEQLCKGERRDAWASHAEEEIIVSMAGLAAQRLLARGPLRKWRARFDEGDILELALSLDLGPEEALALLGVLRRDADELVAQSRDTIELIAEALLEHGTLTHDDVVVVYEHGLAGLALVRDWMRRRAWRERVESTPAELRIDW